MVGQWSGAPPRPLQGRPDPKPLLHLGVRGSSTPTDGFARHVDFARQGHAACRTVHSGQWRRVAVAVSIAVCGFAQGVNALC